MGNYKIKVNFDIINESNPEDKESNFKIDIEEVSSFIENPQKTVNTTFPDLNKFDYYIEIHGTIRNGK